MIRGIILLVLKGMKQRRLRTFLTVLGILIGIAAIVSLISVSKGLEMAITEQFEMMGTDKVIITPGSAMGVMGMGFGSASKLTREDIDAIEDVSGVDIASGMIYSSARVKYEGETKYLFVVGLPTNAEERVLFEEMSGFETEKGRYMREGSSNEANIGWLLANEKFFKSKISIGDKMFIEDEEFKVVGSIKKIGNRADDSQVYISIDKARDLLNKPDNYDTIIVRIKDGYNVNKVSEKIKDKLRDSRDEEEGEETFQVQTMENLMEQFNTILGIVRTVLISIAAISILVGGVGVMNIMYTGVMERTREIGIMKAIGAKESDILLIFLIESGIYGLFGGVIGAAVGLGISKTAEIIATQYLGTTLLKASFDPMLIGGALLFSFIVGCISGIAPARKASKLQPIEALRYE